MTVPAIRLNDGNSIPQLGLGVWKLPDEEAPALVSDALQAGYRHIDTAAIYGNERGVGQGIKRSGIARDKLFVTTKLWNAAHGRDLTLKNFDESLERLGLDYVDLYLIHWPCPARDLYLESWMAMIELKEQGRIKSIGVSNFLEPHLERLITESGEIPVVNQIELHPRFQQKTLRDMHEKIGIRTEAWSPLGQGKLLNDPLLGKIAATHGKSTAQVILRWHLQLGNIVFPKSANPERMRQNLAVFDFELSAEEMAQIATLDSPDGRMGKDPATFNG